MKKLLGIFLASLAMFAFGAAFWMTPLTTSFFLTATDDETACRRLKEMFPATGTYMVPWPQVDASLPKEAGEQAMARQEALHKAGPLVTVHMRHEGAGIMEPKVLLLGFAHELIAMTVAALFMGSLLAALNTYVRRVGFMAVIGLVIAWFSPLSQPIWWFHPWPVHVVDAVYIVLAWLVAGLVLAAFIKPTAPRTP